EVFLTRVVERHAQALAAELNGRPIRVGDRRAVGLLVGGPELERRPGLPGQGTANRGAFGCGGFGQAVAQPEAADAVVDGHGVVELFDAPAAARAEPAPAAEAGRGVEAAVRLVERDAAELDDVAE